MLTCINDIWMTLACILTEEAVQICTTLSIQSDFFLNEIHIFKKGKKKNKESF